MTIYMNVHMKWKRNKQSSSSRNNKNKYCTRHYESIFTCRRCCVFFFVWGKHAWAMIYFSLEWIICIEYESQHKMEKFLNSLHCVLSKVSGKHLGQTQSRYNLLYNHTGCICLDFIHCICSSVSSKRFHKKIFSHTEFISVHWVFKWFLNLSTRDDA